MDVWIKHAQNYFLSGCADEKERKEAINTCRDNRIILYLSRLPVSNVEDAEMANDLRVMLGDSSASLMVELLAKQLIIKATGSPLVIPDEQRQVCFEIINDLVEKTSKFPQLLPSSGSLLNTLGAAYRELGDNSASQAAYEHAVTAYRQLVEIEPIDYLPDLASTLNSVCSVMRLAHEFDKAQEACEDSLEIYQRLAEVNSVTYLPDVAMVFNNLGNLLADTRKYEYSQDALEQAIDIYCKLAKKDPTGYLPDVAMVRNNLGNLLHSTRSYIAGRSNYEDALRDYRKLCEHDPNKYMPKVAMVHTNLGNLLRSIREFDKARKNYEEALRIYRSFADIEVSIFLPRVAMTLNNLGALFGDLHEFDRGLNAYEEGLSIYRELVEIEEAVYISSLANTLNNIATLQVSARNFSAGKAAYEESISIWRDLSSRSPQVYSPEFAQTLNNFGTLLRNSGEYTSSRESFQEALVIYRNLVSADKKTYLPNLSMTLNNLGNFLVEVNETSTVRDVFKEALAIDRSLAKSDPDTYLHVVATTLANLANLDSKLKEYEVGLEGYREALKIMRKLARNDARAYLPDVAKILNNYGSLLHSSGDQIAAKIAFEEALKIVEAYPQNAGRLYLHKNEIAISYTYLLTEAVVEGEFPHAFSLSVAMRDGTAASRELYGESLLNTQQWLSHHNKKTGSNHQILLASSSIEGGLLLGLVSENSCTYEHLEKQAVDWNILFPIAGELSGINDPQSSRLRSLERQRFARSIWNSMSSTLQLALYPKAGLITLVSGDSHWNNFPWEILRFGDGEDHYLGLHQALPRIGGVRSVDLEAQLSFRQLGGDRGTISIFAPFDTGSLPLLGVVEEVKAIEKSICQSGGEIGSIAKGTQASNTALDAQLSSGPDIFYFSGHGNVIRNEEFLVVHQDLDSGDARSHLSYFGKDKLLRLQRLAEKNVFPMKSLIILNSCFSGRVHSAGGFREDIVAAFLSSGAGAVIASALPIADSYGKELGELLVGFSSGDDIAHVVLNARNQLARELCHDLSDPLWGAWCMIHLHGNPNALMPNITRS